MRIVSRWIEIVPGESTHPVQPILLKVRLGLVDDHAFSPSQNELWALRVSTDLSWNSSCPEEHREIRSLARFLI